LDHRAVSYWVAEGDAKFDDVGASFGSGEHDFSAGVERRIASRNVGDQPEFTCVCKSAKFS
jgi:hypothetical protein